MSSYKERWFADMERRLAENEDRGMDFDEAYSKAAEDAYDALVDGPSPIDRFDMMTPEDIEAEAEQAAWHRDRE